MLKKMPDLGDELSILVENMGRVGYGSANVDFKGLIKNVTLDSEVLTGLVAI